MPLLWISLAFLAGLALAEACPLAWWAWAGLALASAAAAFLEKRLLKPTWLFAFRRAARVSLFLLAAALFSGAMRFQLSQPVFTAADLAWYNGQNVVLIGQVSGYPDVRDNAVQLTVQMREIRLTGSDEYLAVRGKALVRLPVGGEWQYGDVIRLKGEITTPSENEEFSYREYLAVRGIHSTMYYPYADILARGEGNALMAGIYRLREHANHTLQEILPQPEAGLLSGILLGLEHDIPADLEHAFQETGTTHIIAISGFNIAILSGLFFKGAGQVLPRVWAPAISILAIGLYAALVGGQASVVRAAIMGGMALIGRQIGRRGVGVNTLAFTAAVMCVFNPLLLHDVSFQLSFMATLGLVLYADPLQERLQARLEKRLSQAAARRLAGWGSEYLLFTLAAQVTTLPLIIYHFERLSLSSLLANVLILPAQPLVMILGGIAVIAGMLWLPLGKVLGIAAGVLPAYTNQMVRLLAGIPGGSVQLGLLPAWVLLLVYALLFAATPGSGLRGFFPQLTPLAKRIRPAAVLIALALLAAGLWRGAAHLPDGKLHVHVLNVPDGPALLVRMPEGEAVLIDGGSSASRLSSELGRRMPLFERQLDAVLVTGRKATPLAALPVTLERFPAQMLLWSHEAAGLRNGERITEVLTAQSARMEWLAAGQSLNSTQGAAVRVLTYTDNGAALVVEWQRFSLLIPGGIPLNLLSRQDTAAVDVLLLSEADLFNTPAAQWDTFPATLILYGGAANPGFPMGNERWLSLDEFSAVEVITNGSVLWAATHK